jgi:cupin 2 domain-containing protein
MRNSPLIRGSGHASVDFDYNFDSEYEPVHDFFQKNTMSRPSNWFRDLPSSLPEEIFETIVNVSNFRIERIVSHGQFSPEGFWYDQNMNEWVILLRGAGRLQFEDRIVEMRPGDYLNIPAHERHRIDWTTPDEPSIWLVVHYGDPC